MFKSRIPEIIAELPKRMDLVTYAVAEEIAKQAAARAPVGSTGDLRSSLEPKHIGDESAGVMAAWYYYFLEFGVPAYDTPAQPFLIPAVESLHGGIAEAARVGLANL